MYVYVCVRVRIYLREYNPFAFDVPSDGKCPLFFFSLVLFRLPILLFDYLRRLILKKEDVGLWYLSVPFFPCGDTVFVVILVRLH